jgi:chromosome segregation and condensation protein ScpB
MLEAGEEAVSAAIAELQNGLQGGVVLVDDGGEVELRVGAEASALIEKIRKEEYSRDIGKAGLEALSAVLYRGPLTRSEIHFIRGVNSSQTLRTPALRGLVRKVQNPKDERSFLYEATTELLAQLGVTRAQDLPDYADVRAKLAQLEEAYRQKQTGQQ